MQKLNNIDNSATGKKLGIIGMGISGRAVAEYASKLGYEIYTYDSKSSTNTLNPNMHIDVLCISPGINLRLLDENPDKKLIEIITKAQNNETEIVNDIELFFKHFKRRTIAITGSYGKSTVSSMVSFMLNHLGIKNILKGNIGLPIFAKETISPENKNSQTESAENEESKEKLKEDMWFDEDSVLVLELSSAQLTLMKSMKAEIGALLNIYPHHLDMHGSIPEYIKAKRQILELSDKQVIVMEGLSAQLAAYYPLSQQIDFDTIADKLAQAKNKKAMNQMDSLQIVSELPKYELPKQELQEKEKNIQTPKYTLFGKNCIAAASIVCEFIGSFDKYEELISVCEEDFKPLPHRMEYVMEMSMYGNNITVVNDSKATDVHAVVAAIENMDTKIVLLCGGKYNTEAASNWKLLLNKKLLSKIKYIIAFGECGDFLYKFFKDSVRVSQAPTLREACIIASEYINDYNGRLDLTILLSPGCQSYDEFRDFGDRGEKFVQYMKELL